MRWYSLLLTYLVSGSLCCWSKQSFSALSASKNQGWATGMGNFNKQVWKTPGKYAKLLAFPVFIFILVIIVQGTWHYHSYYFLSYTIDTIYYHSYCIEQNLPVVRCPCSLPWIGYPTHPSSHFPPLCWVPSMAAEQCSFPRTHHPSAQVKHCRKIHSQSEVLSLLNL